MKRLLKLVVAVALITALLASTMVVASAAAPKLTLNLKKATIWVEEVDTPKGEVVDLRATYTGTGDIKWLSLNTGVATLSATTGNNVRVSAAGIGSAIILAYVEETGAYAMCNLTVANKVRVKNVGFYDSANKKISKATVNVTSFPVADVSYEASLKAGWLVEDGTNKIEDQFTFASSNTAVVDNTDSEHPAITIDEHGKVTIKIKGTGKTTITATSKDNPKRAAKLALTVSAEKAVSKITLTNADTGNTKINPKVTFAAAPASNEVTIRAKAVAKAGDPTNAVLEWKSSDENIATVTKVGESATDATVKFLSTGKVTITATATDGSNKSAKVAFNVTIAKTDYADTIVTNGAVGSAEAKEIKNAENIDLKLTNKAETTDTFSFTAVAKKGTNDALVKGITWKNSSPKVVGVEYDASESKYVITPKAPGKATITVTAVDGSKKSMKFTVTVKAEDLVSIAYDEGKPAEEGGIGPFVDSDGNITLQRGTITQLNYKLNPEDTYGITPTYKSSNTKVVTVSKTGEMTAVNAGTAKITVTAGKGKAAKSFVLGVIVQGYAAKHVVNLSVTTGGINQNSSAPMVGDTLTAAIKYNGKTGEGWAYQWAYSDNAELTSPTNLGAEATQLVTDATAGKYIFLTASKTINGDEVTQVWQCTTAVDEYEVTQIKMIDANVTGKEKVVTKPLKDQKLNAVLILKDSTGKTFEQKDADTNVTYKWTIDNADITNTTNQLTVGDATNDLGKKLKLTVTKAGSSVYTVGESGVTWEAAQESLEAIITEKVTIKGAARFPQTLEAVAAVEYGGTVEKSLEDFCTFKWTVGTSTESAGNAYQYGTKKEDVGSKIYLTVTPNANVKADNNKVTLTASTGTVAQNKITKLVIQDAKQQNVKQPVVDEVLTAVLTTNDKTYADANAKYQWGTIVTTGEGDNKTETFTEISGATSKTFTVTTNQLLYPIAVKVTLAGFEGTNVNTDGEITVQTQYETAKGEVDAVKLYRGWESEEKLGDVITNKTVLYAGDKIKIVPEFKADAKEVRASEMMLELFSVARETKFELTSSDGKSTITLEPNADTYTFTKDDVEKKFAYQVSVSYKDYEGTKTSIRMRAPIFHTLTTATITGGADAKTAVTTPVVGQTLNAGYTSTKTAADGDVTYKWQYQDGNTWTDIENATEASWTVVAGTSDAYIGKKIRVVITPATDLFDKTKTATAEVTNPVIATLKLTDLKTVQPLVDTALTTKLESGSNDLTSSKSAKYSWTYVDAAANEAELTDKSSYTPQAKDIGRQIKLTVTFDNYIKLETAPDAVVNQTATISDAKLTSKKTIEVTLDKASVLAATDFAVTVGESSATVTSIVPAEKDSVKDYTKYIITLESDLSEKAKVSIANAAASKLLLEGSKELTVPDDAKITDLSITSNATSGQNAIAGNEITLTITANYKPTEVKICSSDDLSASIVAGENGVYTVKYTLTTNDEPTGDTETKLATFSVTVTDELGGTVIKTAKMSGDDVTIGKTPAE